MQDEQIVVFKDHNPASYRWVVLVVRTLNSTSIFVSWVLYIWDLCGGPWDLYWRKFQDVQVFQSFKFLCHSLKHGIVIADIIWQCQSITSRMSKVFTKMNYALSTVSLVFFFTIFSFCCTVRQNIVVPCLLNLYKCGLELSVFYEILLLWPNGLSLTEVHMHKLRQSLLLGDVPDMPLATGSHPAHELGCSSCLWATS